MKPFQRLIDIPVFPILHRVSTDSREETNRTHRKSVLQINYGKSQLAA